MANEIEIQVSGDDDTGDLFDGVDRRVAEFARRVEEKLGEAGERAGDKFRRGVDGRLRDSRGRFAKEFTDGVASAAGAAGETAARRFSSSFDQIFGLIGTSVTGLFGGISGLGASTAATGGLNLLVLAVLALVAAVATAAAGMILLAPIFGVIVGAAGATTTVILGLAGSIAVLGMGLGGIGDAWTAYGKKAAGGGQSASAAARAAAAAQHEVKQATVALADAQRAALAAQADIARAREDETERLQDLSRSLAGARLDEKSAALAVLEAEQRLREARQGGSGLDVQRAILGVAQAKQNLEDVRDRVGDLSAEQEEANRKGVEGSDAVQGAFERQRQAQQRLEDASYRLSQAQAAVKDSAAGAGGGVDAFGDAMAKLSPNAQKLVNTLIGLRDRFGELKKRTQDRLLAGFDAEVQNLATRWLPVLDPMLGALADRFNGFGKKVFQALGEPKFIGDINSAMATFGAFIGKIGDAMPKVISAFGTLSRASKPFFDMLGDKLAGMLTNFGNWIEKLDKNGKLDEFFKDAADALDDLWTIGGLTLDIIGEIIEILFPASKKESDSFLGGVKGFLEGVKAWLSDPDNQKKIQDWIKKIQDFVDNVIDWSEKADEWVTKLDGWITKIDEWATAITSIPDKIKRAWKSGTGMFDGIKEAFRSALNWVIARWNSLEFRLPTANFLGQEVGGGRLGVPHVEYLAHGGIRGGLAVVGERGRELVDLPQGSRVHPNGTTEAMLASGGSSGILRLEIDLTGGDSELMSLLEKWIKRIVRVRGGGNVQLTFGRNRGTASATG